MYSGGGDSMVEAMEEKKSESIMSVDEHGQPTISISSSPAGIDFDMQDEDAIAIRIRDLSLWYSGVQAVDNVSLDIPENQVTALIGPSGCGKSTLLRCINRMNDLITGVTIEGAVQIHGENIYEKDVDPVSVRRNVGMVFQKPNPFPKSIYDNVAFGAKVNGYRGDMDELVRESLEQAALWDEVSDKLNKSGLALSGGQQQRLCIARAIAVKPEVILMDEPCSALDPIATQRIEDLMRELRLVEFNQTQEIFTNPSDSRTEDYITGRFG
jgi:phosphate transport system ATP-binding protein